MRRLIGFSLAFFSVSLFFYILIAGQSFFIPLLIALVIAYFIIALAEGLGKITLVGKRLPISICFLAAISILLAAVFVIFTMISNNVNTLVDSAPIYQQKFQNLIQNIFAALGRPLPDLSQKFKELDFASLLTQVAFVLTDIAGLAGIIGIYVVFILVEYSFFDQKIKSFFQSEEGLGAARKIIDKVARQIKSYLRIKTLLSVLTALCSYLVMNIVGVDFAEFWSVLIFLLNFIPTIGSIVATIFPCLLTLLQFGALMPFAMVTVSLVAIQFVIGNVLEPRIMGSHFNLSGLVIILSLILWGKVWGIIGMLLCMPLMMIISIILSNFSRTKPIAILLSRTGTLDE